MLESDVSCLCERRKDPLGCSKGGKFLPSERRSTPREELCSWNRLDKAMYLSAKGYG
jgi:hypothetical protein